MSACTVHDPFDLKAAASEVHSALRLRLGLLREAAEPGRIVAPDVWRRADRLYEWHPTTVRMGWCRVGLGTGLWCSGGEPDLITPERLDALVAETVALVEADRKRIAYSADARTLLRFWTAWGCRLPQAVAARALRRSEVRTWAYPMLTGRVS